MRKLTLSSGLTIFFLTSANAVEVNFSVPDSLPVTLPDVEVSAHTSSEKITSAVPVQSIDASKIREAGVTDISDALRRLPGIALHDYGGLGGSKTLTVRGLGSQHTGVIYDGSPITDSRSGSIDLSRHSLTDLSSISLSYGDIDDIFLPARSVSSASTLVITSLESEKAPMVMAGTDPNEKSDAIRYSLRARLTGGSFGFINPFLKCGLETGKHGNYTLSCDFIHSDNNYPFTLHNGKIVTKERRNHSEIRSWHGELNARWRIGAGQLSAKLYGYDNDRDLPGPVKYYVTKSDEHLHERNYFGQIHYKGRLSSLLSLCATAKYDWSATRYLDVQEIYPGGRLDNRYYQREYYATAGLLLTPNTLWNFSYAADWSTLELTGNGMADQHPSRNSLLQTVAGRFSKRSVSVTIRLLHSLYFNHVSNGESPGTQSRLSPSASISVRPVEDMDFFIRGSFKDIFRLPTFSELYFYHLGTVNLEPETTRQYNLGATLRTAPGDCLTDLSVTCDTYLNRVDNKITAIPYNMFVWKMTNLGKVRVMGLDCTLSASFVPHESQSIVFDAAYSFQKAQIRTNRKNDDWMKQVAYIPVHSGSASVSWLNPWVNLALHATATGSRFTTNQNLDNAKLDPFCDAGLTLFRIIKVGRSTLELKLEMLNILNTQYEMIARYPMPGRSWRAGIEFKI